MKNRVLTVSLSLLVCLCCCFSGFGSVKASAAYSSYPQYDMTVASGTKLYHERPDSSAVYTLSMTKGDDYHYHNSDIHTLTDDNFYFTTFIPNSDETDDRFIFPVNTNLFDYYVVASLGVDADADNFSVDSFNIGSVSNLTYPITFNESGLISELDVDSYVLTYDNSKSDYKAKTYNFTAPLNIDLVGDLEIGIVQFTGVNGIVKPNTVFFSLSVIVTNKGDEQALYNIIQAINNQTNALQGSIGQAADDVQQSIEDQYQMEDEEDFGFSDIQQQYEDKMGVLTFGTETTIQMLELFSPSNAGEAYIRVPGWSMDVQGETYQIWDEYVFYFDSIEENFPFLVTTMRAFTVAMFYVSIVGYITKVYERNFLAK